MLGFSEQMAIRRLEETLSGRKSEERLFLDKYVPYKIGGHRGLIESISAVYISMSNKLL